MRSLGSNFTEHFAFYELVSCGILAVMTFIVVIDHIGAYMPSDQQHFKGSKKIVRENEFINNSKKYYILML